MYMQKNSLLGVVILLIDKDIPHMPLSEFKNDSESRRYLAELNDYTSTNEALYKLTEVNDKVSSRLVLPTHLQDIFF